MKKALWTMNINDYLPEVCKISFPYLKHYADKIGADFQVISIDKFPETAVNYNKLQIYELGADYDYNIFIDADALIHPDFFDITLFIRPDECFHMSCDFSPIRFRPDWYMINDGRYIGAATWFVISTRKTHNLWKPSEQSKEEMLRDIFPTELERAIGNKPEARLDEYVLTRNIAKYHLKHKTMVELRERHKMCGSFWWAASPDEKVPLYYFHHDYRIPKEQRAKKMKDKIKEWTFIPKEK